METSELGLSLCFVFWYVQKFGVVDVYPCKVSKGQSK